MQKVPMKIYKWERFTRENDTDTLNQTLYISDAWYREKTGDAECDFWASISPEFVKNFNSDGVCTMAMKKPHEEAWRIDVFTPIDFTKVYRTSTPAQRKAFEDMQGDGFHVRNIVRDDGTTFLLIGSYDQDNTLWFNLDTMTWAETI